MRNENDTILAENTFLDALFSASQEAENNQNPEPPAVIPLARLHPFPGHPYKVEDNEEMETLTESIREHGILTPLLVRQVDGIKTE